MALPVVIHIPHSSTDIPDELRESFLLSDSDLSRELINMTDHFTDDLFARHSDDCRIVRFPVSRLVVDPERFVDDDDEPMAAVGMGAVYTKSSSGYVLREPLASDDRARLIAQYYAPHHAELTSAVDNALANGGRCLVIDAHSFPSEPLPYEADRSLMRPEICIGTDEFHTPSSLAGEAKFVFEAASFEVAFNEPFSGAIVPAKHWRSDPDVNSLMIEVNRSLYLDEETGQKSVNYDQLRSRLSKCLARLVSAWMGTQP